MPKIGKTGVGMTEMAAPKLTRKELTELLRAEFPEMFNSESGYQIEKVWHGGCVVRRHFDRTSLRPGGTLSGATMMALADFAVYVAVLAAVGWVPLGVTTNLTINFLKKACAARPSCRSALDQARQAARRRRGRYSLGRRGRAGCPRDLDLFDPTAS